MAYIVVYSVVLETLQPSSISIELLEVGSLTIFSWAAIFSSDKFFSSETRRT